MSEQLEQRTFTLFSVTKNRRVAHTGGSGNTSGESLEYARRLVAAWNAVKGIETADLEMDPSVNLLSLHVARADAATALLDEAQTKMQWFVDRCNLGEIRSRKTKAAFESFLDKLDAKPREGE